MQVKDETSFFPSLLDLLLYMVNRRRCVFGWFLPHSIGINSSQFRSCIAVNDSIRIDHRYDLEDVIIVKSVICLNCLDH